MTCLPSLPAPTPTPSPGLSPEAGLGEGGSGVSWGPARIRTPRQGRKCWSAAQAEPRVPMTAGLVQGAQQSCRESAARESGSRGARVHGVSVQRGPL